LVNGAKRKVPTLDRSPWPSGAIARFMKSRIPHRMPVWTSLGNPQNCIW
jgi:hypothetical protein